MSSLSAIKKREKEFRRFTRKWIEKYDAHLVETVESQIAKKTKPLRHPNGKGFDKHSLDYFWSDAIWCGDVTLDSLQEFYGLGDAEVSELEDDLINWANEVFSDEFKAVRPELAHVLEG